MTPKLLYCEEFVMNFSSQRYCGWNKIVCQSDYVPTAKTKAYIVMVLPFYPVSTSNTYDSRLRVDGAVILWDEFC